MQPDRPFWVKIFHHDKSYVDLIILPSLRQKLLLHSFSKYKARWILAIAGGYMDADFWDPAKCVGYEGNCWEFVAFCSVTPEMHKKFPSFLHLRLLMGQRKQMMYLARAQFYYHLLRLPPLFYRHKPYREGGDDYLLAREADPERAKLIGREGG